MTSCPWRIRRAGNSARRPTAKTQTAMHDVPQPLRLICLAYVLVAAGVSIALTSLAANADGRPAAGPPGRIVSMNLCTDQLALLVAAPEQIHSLSYISRDPASSPLAEEARRYPPNHGLAEEIFLMRPDLVLAGAYTRRETTNMLIRLGFRVESFAPATSFDDIRANIRRLGHLLGREEHASHLLAAFDRARNRRRAATQADPGAPPPLAALYYANSHTSGRSTLASDILAHARLENLATSLGLGGIVRLPLELIVFSAPDLLITGDAGHHPTARAGAALQHPALRANRGQIVAMDNRWSCGTPAVLDIVRELEDVVMEKTRPERPTTPSKG